MSAEEIMDWDTFYSVLADSDIEPYLFQPEQENWAFNVIIARTEEFIALTDDIYHQHWLDMHIKVAKFPF